MKRFAIVTTLMLVASISFGQTKLPVSYPSFESWAKQVKISGYPYMESENGGNEYAAMFGSSPEKTMQIRVSGTAEFKQYLSMAKGQNPYKWRENEAIYFEFAEITFFVVNLKEKELSISFGKNGKASKEVMEDMALKANLEKLGASKPDEAYAETSSDFNWPETIPADLRISNVVSIESLGPDETYVEVIQVKATMNQMLIKSIEKILNKYDSQLDLVSTEKIDFICGSASDLEQLQADFKPGSSVTFFYYVK